MDRQTRAGNREEAAAIGQALQVAIRVARGLGWSSERTLREAEAYATGADGAMMLRWLEGEVLR